MAIDQQNKKLANWLLRKSHSLLTMLFFWLAFRSVIRAFLGRSFACLAKCSRAYCSQHFYLFQTWLIVTHSSACSSYARPIKEIANSFKSRNFTLNHFHHIFTIHLSTFSYYYQNDYWSNMLFVNSCKKLQNVLQKVKKKKFDEVLYIWFWFSLILPGDSEWWVIWILRRNTTVGEMHFVIICCTSWLSIIKEMHRYDNRFSRNHNIARHKLLCCWNLRIYNKAEECAPMGVKCDLCSTRISFMAKVQNIDVRQFNERRIW